MSDIFAGTSRSWAKCAANTTCSCPWIGGRSRPVAHILPESPYRRSLFPAGDATPPSGLAAVCLTGLQRSFPEIGNNIAEAVRDLLAPRHIYYFGIKPVNDSWAAIEYVLLSR